MMTDPDRLLDLLADHDAGLPVDPAVLDDPRARAVLDALAATRAELAALPPVPPPPGISARWNAALAGSAHDAARPDLDRAQQPPLQPSVGGDDPVPTRPGDLSRHPPAASPPLDRPPPDRGASAAPIDRAPRQPGPPATTSGTGHGLARGEQQMGGGPGPRPPGARPARGPTSDRRPGPTASRARRAGRRPRPAVVAGLVLAVVLVVAGVVGARPDPPSVTAAQLGGIARAAVGVRDAGALADPLRRAACLRAVARPGLAPDAPLAGSRTVVFEGHAGVILLLVTGELGVFRAVVVDPDCGAGGGTLLADTRIGG